MPGSAGLGALLRECREAKGVSLEDLSRATRIASRLILALEEDRFPDLPAPVFVRGFIRAYCAAVGEPPERAVTLYDGSLEAPRAPSVVPRTVLADAVAPRRRIRWRRLAPSLLVGGLLVGVGGAVYLLVSSAAPRSAGAPPPAPDGTAGPAARDGIAAPATGAPAEPARPSAEPARPSAEPARAPAEPPHAPAAPAPPVLSSLRTPAPVARAHVLVATAHEETWVSVRAEDGTASQELLPPGTVREWRSPGRFTVTVGNAGGLTFELDGVALPSLGDPGQVVRDVRLPREPAP
jgi:cytoskeleton protein RodZ